MIPRRYSGIGIKEKEVPKREREMKKVVKLAHKFFQFDSTTI
jgi:hypothetical protein